MGFRMRELLADALTADPSSTAGLLDIAAQLRTDMDADASELIADVPQGRLPLRLSKGRVTDLLHCERYAEARATSPHDDRAEHPAVVKGRLVDRLVHHHVLSGPTDRRGDELADGCLAALAADGEPGEVSESDRPSVVATLDAAADHLDADWGVVDTAWWPQAETTARTALAGGDVLLTGRLDVVLGGMRSGRPLVLVEVKSRGLRAEDRADLWWYGLVAAWAWGEMPAVVAGWSALAGATMPEPVRADGLRTAADRTAAALQRAVELASGREPTATPSAGACPFCPEADRCEPGLAFLATRRSERDDHERDWGDGRDDGVDWEPW
jgi:hypothetical protein